MAAIDEVLIRSEGRPWAAAEVRVGKERGDGVHDAAVDQYVDPAEAADSGIDGRGNARGVGHVQGDGEKPVAIPEVLWNPCRIADRDHDVVAVGARGTRNFRAEAPRCAGDEPSSHDNASLPRFQSVFAGSQSR
ncbi:hypothetical protein GCM10011583_35080 [Streptomyces camponoticapitis]|uniref:Uncharacterized protein n=1 Tax=Streptomyces camponoticapitis TaxID=1616125 RepID=A0ABQ2E8A7_9ACTN|nr:hypothetical protein GCM10011583_35080 [Streptomyces camponoticapitis]